MEEDIDIFNGLPYRDFVAVIKGTGKYYRVNQPYKNNLIKGFFDENRFAFPRDEVVLIFNPRHRKNDVNWPCLSLADVNMAEQRSSLPILGFERLLLDFSNQWYFYVPKPMRYVYPKQVVFNISKVIFKDIIDKMVFEAFLTSGGLYN